MRVGEHEAIHDVGLDPSTMNEGTQAVQFRHRAIDRLWKFCLHINNQTRGVAQQARERHVAVAGDTAARPTDGSRPESDGNVGLISISRVNINSSSQRIMRVVK